MTTRRRSYDPQARLVMIKPVLAEVKPGELVNADEMAKLARMTWQNLKTTIDKDSSFPVASRGGMGVAWAFDAHAVLSYMVEGYEAQVSRLTETATRLAKLSGISDAAENDMSDAQRMTPLEIKQMTEALMAQTRLRQMQRDLVALADVKNTISEIFSTLQAEALAFIGSYDPAGTLPADIREAIMDHQRKLLVKLQDATVKRIEKLSGGA